MSVRPIFAVAVVMPLMGCSPDTRDGEAETIDSALARVEKQCRVTPGTLTLGADNYVKFQPAVDEKYERVDCVMRELKKPEFANHVKLGFVGNEMHPREEQK